MKIFTQTQKEFFVKKGIKVGSVYEFPPLCNELFISPDYGSESIPLNRSIIGSMPDVKLLAIENGFCKFKIARMPLFSCGNKNPYAFAPVHEFEARELSVMIALFLICSIPFITYNIFKSFFTPKSLTGNK